MTVPFTFSKASCVAVGTFNIYIVQPPFLKEANCVEVEEETWEVETDLSQPGFRYEFPQLHLKCAVRPDRFFVESENITVDCGSVVHNVIKALKWTPLTAIGINASFTLKNKDEIREIERNHFPTLPEVDGAAIKHRMVHVSVVKDEQRYNLQLGVKDEVAEFAMNSHSQLEDSGGRKQAWDMAVELTQRFFTHRSIGTKLATSLFGIRFDHVDYND